MIKKKSIVWYWHRESSAWKKAKVISIACPPNSTNPWGIFVKERRFKKLYFVPRLHWSEESSEPKPRHTF